jgi:hypothetical protein
MNNLTIENNEEKDYVCKYNKSNLLYLLVFFNIKQLDHNYIELLRFNFFTLSRINDSQQKLNAETFIPEKQNFFRDESFTNFNNSNKEIFVNNTFESPQMEITGFEIFYSLKDREFKYRIITEFHNILEEYSKEFRSTIENFKNKLIYFLNENSYNIFGEEFNEDKHLVFDLNKILYLNELVFLNYFIEDNDKKRIAVYYENDSLKTPLIINNLDDLTRLLIKTEKLREQKNIIEKKDKCLAQQDLINGNPFFSVKTDFKNPNCRFIFRIKNKLEIDRKANKAIKVIIYFEITQMSLS